MCGGRSQPAPQPTPVSAQAAAVTSASPRMASEDLLAEGASNAENANKTRKGKKKLRIPSQGSVNVDSSGSGVNVPQ